MEKKKRKKTHVINFVTLSIHDMKREIKQKSVFADIKIFNDNSRNTAIFTQPAQRSAILLKKTPTQVFYCEIPEIFKEIFSYRTPPVASSDIS